MHRLRTIDDVIDTLPHIDPSSCPEIPRPEYISPSQVIPGKGIALAVESMARHTTDEGWQIMQGLQHAGWQIEGHGIGDSLTDMIDILYKNLDIASVLVQDKREWDVRNGDFREKAARFTDVSSLKSHYDLFKLTILKDAHSRPLYHRESAEEIGCHAWLCYYHPRIVKHLAPFIRERDIIRVWHTVDPDKVPVFLPGDKRGSVLMSGAVSGAYPLRRRIVSGWRFFKELKGHLMQHPGYHRDGCATESYLQELSKWKVAICTSSMYGYALRKIIEATACGCRVITDLPTDEILPGIDGNLVRVSPDISMPALRDAIVTMTEHYNDDRQQQLAYYAMKNYDYRVEGRRISRAIENVRLAYND